MHATIRKVIWDMINTLFLTTVAVEPTFVPFLQPSKKHFHGLSCQFFQISLKNRELKIRPVLEYASPVFHRSLPNYISEDLERIQRRAFRIIYPDLSYSVALETVGLPNLHERREKISIDLFDEIVCNPTHSLHSLLPQRKSCKYALRRKSDFTLPLCKTERLKKSFIFSHVYKM